MVSRKSSTTSPAKIAANRRNALKSTGPRTAAGKRRAMLNAVTRDVCPEEFERQLRARGENPWEFCRLHRDLIAIFRPQDRADVLATQSLAPKRRGRRRGKLASGSPPGQHTPRIWTRVWSGCFVYSSTRSASGMSGGITGWLRSWGVRWGLPPTSAAASSPGCSSSAQNPAGESTLGSPPEIVCLRNSGKRSSSAAWSGAKTRRRRQERVDETGEAKRTQVV